MKTTHKLYTALGVAAILTGAATTGLAVSSGISLQADATGENLLANAIIGQTIGTIGSGNWSAVKNDGSATTWIENATFRNAAGNTDGSEVYFLLTRWDVGDHNVYYTYTFDNLEAGVYEFQMTTGSWNNFDPNQIASSQVDFKGMRTTFGTQGGYSLLHQVLDIPMKTSDAAAGEARYNDTKVTVTAKFSVETAGKRSISFTGCHDIMPLCDLSMVKVAGAEAIPSVTAVANAGKISFTADAGTQIYIAYITEETPNATYSLLPTTSYKVSSDGTLYYYAVNAEGVRSEVKTLAVADVPEKATPVNLLKNATTYEGEGWTTWNSAGSTSIADGVLTLSKTSSQNGDYGLYQNLQLENGKTYTFMANYRTSGTNQTKTQFCGFWNANASWVSGAYSDLGAASDWTLTHNTLTYNGTAKCAILATNSNDHTVEYKDVWVIEHPVLSVKMDGETATDHVNTGSLVSIESNLEGFEIYYSIDGGIQMLYDGEFEAPAQSGTLSYRAEFNGLTFAEGEIAVSSDEAALAAAKEEYAQAVQDYAYVATDYPDASQAKLAVFTPALDESATLAEYRAAIDAMKAPASLRAVVESHSAAEAIEGRVDYTSSIVNNRFADGTNGWTAFEGSLSTNTGENPTLADGSNPIYYDKWDGGTWTIRVGQKLADIPAGRYRLALLYRGSDSGFSWFRLRVNSNEVETAEASTATPYVDLLPTYSSEGQLFDNGWNEKYLDFDFAGGELQFSVNAATSTGGIWCGFTNVRLTKIGDIDVAGIAYDQAYTLATSVRDNELYVNVTGEERTALEAAIPAERPEGQEALTAATEAMNTAANAVIDAKSAYDTLVSAKAEYDAATYADASQEKLSALTAALTATPASAAEATQAAEAIISAVRTAELSHAEAEGVEGAVSYTSRLLQATIGDEAIGAHWNDDRSSDANYVRVGSGEAPDYFDGFTHYYDTDNWGKSGQRNTLSQVVNLPAGKYRVALMARSANLQVYTLAANDAQTDLGVNGSEGQMFGHGWNDHTLDFETLNLQNTIAVTAHGSGNSTQCWASWNNFRLTKIGELENATVSLNGYTGEEYAYTAIVLPYAVTGFDADVDVYALTGVNADGQAVITKVEDGKLQAGTPYLLALEGSSADVTLTFSGAPVEETVAVNGDGAVFNSSLIPVTLPAATAAAGARRRAASTEGVHYVLNAAGNAFEKVTADTEIPANSTYLTLPADSEIAANFDSLAVTRDIHTGINAIDADVILDSEAIYDLQGRRVVNPAKGIYIRNGKKIVVR